MPASSETALDVAIGRWLHREKETIGLAARRSCQTKASVDAQNTTAAAASMVLPVLPISVSAIRNEVTTTVKAIAPKISMERRSCFAVSCRNATKPAAATKPTGMLIQNTHAQDTLRMMRPPATGPRTAEIAQTLARYPWIFPRSRAGYRSATMVMATG